MLHKLRAVVLLVIIALSTQIGWSQESDSLAMKSEKKFRFSALGGPGYSPDYGFMLGASLLTTFHFKGMEEFETRSVLPIALALSFGEKVGYNVMMKPQFFLRDDKIRIKGVAQYLELANNYFGVGFENNSNTTRGSDETLYQSQVIQFDPIVNFRIASSSWFIGTEIDIRYDKITNPSQGVIDDPYYQLFGGNESGYSSSYGGIGFNISYDSRDIPSNPYRGILFEMRAISYRPLSNNEDNYSLLSFDYRQYIQLSSKREGRTLAWMISTDDAYGDVPFLYMPTLGSPFDMRGYYAGQYRDMSTSVVMVEYRHKFHVERRNIITKLADRLGFVTWAGCGLMGPSRFDIDGVLPNFGAGLRVEVQPRMNFRFDVGYSPIDNQTLFYLNMTEAF